MQKKHDIKNTMTATATKTACTGLIDAHAHLNEIRNIDNAIRNAKTAGIDKIVAVGMDMASNRKTFELAGRFPGVIYPAIGYHPWSIKEEEIDDNLTFIRENIEKCIALGEVGLDYKVKAPKPVQKDVLKKLLHIAKTHDKPVIVHSRYSHITSYQLVSDACIQKAVFHWYSGPLDVLDNIIKNGYYVSATPALAFSRHHQDAISKAPLDRILIETDSPVKYQGNAAEPSHLLKTLDVLSIIKNKSKEELAKITSNNAVTFFGFNIS